jgi:hypothetical protein
MGIVRFALRFPHTFYVLALILFLGITAISAMPTDIFPEKQNPGRHRHLAIYRVVNAGDGAACHHL